ncbi:signal peptidase I [Candidatus Woesearchaeota archaeon]|nr:signal peptidase I [Candidatus Woesearchaeota archaeon]
MDDLLKDIKRFWHWLWNDDSVLSWALSILFAFVVIKWVLYPLLGLLLGTQFPVVAVVSNSMEHNMGFDDWWMQHQDEYLKLEITEQEFREYPMKNGFNKGDIIILLGIKEDKISRGDIVVYWGGRAYPIIHRVVGVDQDSDGRFFVIKGDNNREPLPKTSSFQGEYHVTYTIPCEEGTCPVILGRGVFRVPWLGWVKIGAVNTFQCLTSVHKSEIGLACFIEGGKERFVFKEIF